jgi:hypothetical protein
MKRLLLISLTTILGIGSLATVASADQNWADNRESYSYDQQEDISEPAHLPQPRRYRTEQIPEHIATETQHNDRRQSLDSYEYNEYRRERRRIRFRRHHHSTRNDPGRY